MGIEKKKSKYVMGRNGCDALSVSSSSPSLHFRYGKKDDFHIETARYAVEKKINHGEKKICIAFELVKKIISSRIEMRFAREKKSMQKSTTKKIKNLVKKK